MRAVKVWLAVGALALFGATARGAESPVRSNEDLARDLMVLTGAGEMGKQAMVQMIDSFRTMSPDIPEEFWQNFIAEADPNELAELGVPIYVKHLTREELEAAVAFYSSPEGRSMVQKLPAIMQESMEVGERWGAQLGAAIVAKLERYQEEQAQSQEEGQGKD